jgi:CRISPR-associated endonuclease/helicase Cas3
VTDKAERITRFWAKTTIEGMAGISVYDHMTNVGCVARCLAETSPEILGRFQLQSETVGALAALHDLGKISPGFQRKCEDWLEKNVLSRIARNWCWDSSMESDHGKVSHAAIQQFLTGIGIDRKTAKFVSTILGAHHGRLSPPNDHGYRPKGAISEGASGIDWDSERIQNARRIWEQFAQSASFTLSDVSPGLWWLAGLTSVADWIGSDERFFPPDRKIQVEVASSLAKNALETIGIWSPEFLPNLSFHDLFHDTEKPEISWVPNEMQQKAFAAVNAPGVYIIEAPMGMGKTEAALWAAYRLLVSGKARGIYFALPTQATSNRMHLRFDKFVRRISDMASPSRLIHGNSWLLDHVPGVSPVATSHGSVADDARTGRDWFASPKRALIAPFGVGTVDQALLGVVAAKHFFVRHFALAGKVVILDEIHSYDLYTWTLIDKLITTLEGLGCTVIVLSATLSGKRRGQILSCEDHSLDDAEIPYPLITGRKEEEFLEPVPAAPPKSRNVNVNFATVEKAAQDSIELARKGGVVVWICNTVDSAQTQYRHLIKLTRGNFPIGLLHARFPFWRREELEAEWMVRLGKGGNTRCGSILVATQIVEQSVDLDADFLITELAPTDMLLQRLGRLWRHERKQRPLEMACFCIIEENKGLEEFRSMDSKMIAKTLGNKAKVYAPYILLRSLQIWKGQSKVLIPSQIRWLIESTYKDQPKEPDAWRELSYEWFGTDSAKEMMASRNSNLWQVALEDEEGVQTRINEMPTVSVVLCRSISKQEAVFLDGATEKLGGDTALFPTAQAIHRNLVKIPEYCFDHIEPCPSFADYLHGMQCLGIVRENGAVEVKGLKTETRLFYSIELGVSIEKTSEKEGT